MQRQWQGLGRLMAAALVSGSFGCIAIKADSKAYFDPSLPGVIPVRRVALVPNRLPANLLEPEKWRRSNWDVAAKALRAKGYDVVDYDASVASFEKSALPIEDTHASRDKYAELASPSLSTRSSSPITARSRQRGRRS